MSVDGGEDLSCYSNKIQPVSLRNCSHQPTNKAYLIDITVANSKRHIPGSLLPGPLRDSLHVTCGLTACTPGSAPGPTLGNEYGKTLLYLTVGLANVTVPYW